MSGFAIPPVGKLLGGRWESHDPVVGVLRVSFPTKPDSAVFTTAHIADDEGEVLVRAIQTAMLRTPAHK